MEGRWVGGVWERKEGERWRCGEEEGEKGGEKSVGG